MRTSVFALFCAACAVSVQAQPPSDDDKKSAVERLWSIAEPAQVSKEKSFSSAVEIGKEGKVTMANRGMLKSREKYGKVRVGCTWSYRARDDIPREYHDELWIVLRASGERNKWPFDPKDGIALIIRPDEKAPVFLGECKEKGAPLKLDDRKGIEVLKGKSQRIQIEDRGDAIVVFVDYKEVLTVKVKPAEPGHVLIFNGVPYPGPKITTLESMVLEEWSSGK